MSEDHKLIGIIDEPIKPYLKSDTNDQSDRLGVDDYANALGEFIKKTNTPMTIGIQGEWGSGKTSLLNNLMNLLDGISKNTTYECIWVNTWEHSLLKTPEEALISIVTDISNQVTKLNKENKMAGQITATGKRLLSGAVRIAAGMTMGVAGQEVAGELLESKTDNSIRKLREDLESFIDKIINDDKTNDIKNIKKIVFFIDDLDRIEPKDAVKVLELLKNIFSIKHCVFVLAIDYQVIIKGLKDKFGEKTDENEREFRSFFDKIIQLPFTMPTSQYRVAEYVEGLLQDIGFVNKNEKFDIEVVNKILENTIGSNPRSIKRLINNLSLINILSVIKQKKNSSVSNLNEKLLEFALVCCQVAYPIIYDLITYRPDISQWDDDFSFSITEKKEEQDPKFQQAFTAAKESEDFDDDWEKALFRITFSYIDLRRQASKISRFLSLLVDQKINHTEEQLVTVLSSTSTTVVTSNDDKNFRKPAKGERVSGYEDFKNVAKMIAIDKGYDEKIVEYRVAFFDKIFNFLKDSLNGDSNSEIQFYGRSVSFMTNSKGNMRKFATIYPYEYAKSDKSLAKVIKIGLLKDPNKDFRLPKIEGMKSIHLRNFSTEYEKWFMSDTYDLCMPEEAFDKHKDKVLILFNRSKEIIANKEELLKPIELATLSEEELKELEKKSKSDYTYDV